MLQARAQLGWTDEEDAEVLRRAPMVEKEKRLNLLEESRTKGQPVRYGAIIQLKHVKSGKFLTLTKQTARQPGAHQLLYVGHTPLALDVTCRAATQAP